MLIELILTLGIKIIFLEADINKYCQVEYLEYPYVCSGCANFSNYTIYLNLHPEEKMEEVLTHEVGHFLFLGDEEAEKVISSYEPKGVYYKQVYDSESKLNQEKLADYFIQFMTDKNFQFKNPSLYIFFRDKINKIIK